MSQVRIKAQATIRATCDYPNCWEYLEVSAATLSACEAILRSEGWTLYRLAGWPARCPKHRGLHGRQ